MFRLITKHLYFCLLVIILPWQLHAQTIRSFSGDSVKFITELHTLFENLTGNERKMTQELMADFIQVWNQEKFDPPRKKMIYYISNQILKKKLRTFPDFYNWIKSLDVFINTHQPDESFQEWSVILKKLIDSKYSRHFTKFVDFSTDLFAENLIYNQVSTKWKIITPRFTYRFDTVPSLAFDVTDLVCLSGDDSLMIFNTKGIFYPLTDRWKGSGGRVDWRRAGYNPQEVYTDFSDYEIQTNLSKFTAENVRFYHKKYFPEPIMGRFTDKIQIDIPAERKSYPSFHSYDKQLAIENVFQGINFLGGFALEGARIIGFGDQTGDARIDFTKDGKTNMTIRSQDFIIRSDRISSGKASVAIYFENDSIFHPGLQVKYIDEKKEMTLTKDERATVITPWFDSWHQVEIYCEALSWKVNERKMNFESVKGPNVQGRAIFESGNYYSGQRFDKIQAMDEVNPLYVLGKYSIGKKSRILTLDELVTFLEKDPSVVEAMLLNLATRGFLIYNSTTQKAELKEKLFNYIKAKNNQTDYDVIFFISNVNNIPNGILNLDNFDLKIQGVHSVFVSDSQLVYIYPANEEIILKKNRDFLFSGKIDAGLFDFYAKSCSFEYDKFRVNLPAIDSMGFYVRSRTKDLKTGRYPLVRVKTFLTNLSGDLLIDDPSNKSGRKSLKDYPIFNSKNESYAAWDKKYIQNGVYKKDTFYYKVYPFTYKNIGKIGIDSLQLKGYLSSAGIFPDLEKPLKVRPDYSLGIETVTDEKGLPVYGGKGVFISRIDLSNQGLRGNGKLIYLGSTTQSDNFIFYPDSLRTMAKNFVTKEVIAAAENPPVHGDSLNQLWLPKKDSMILSTTRKDLAMYNDQSLFFGEIGLTPNGMTGIGTIKIKDAEMDSRTFHFKSKSFDANIANFRIKSVNLNELSISTKNYRTHFDFQKGKGEFKSNIGISKVEFPFNKYICSMDRFDWMIDNEEISLSNEMNSKVVASDTMSLAALIDLPSPGSEFISVHPKQDSLRFFARRARYNLHSNIINAEDVKLIRVGDAAIFPDSSKVTILKDAQMKPLNRAVIIANRDTKYHSFYNAGVTITSRKKYFANADYDYIDRNGEHEQIHFSKIVSDTTNHTVAEGIIPEDARFRLSPEFSYKGDVKLKAADKNMIFDGGFQPVTDCFSAAGYWVRFTSTIDPKKVELPVSSEIRDVNHERLYLGMVFSNIRNRIYPAFFSRHETFSDSLMSTVEGMATFNTMTKNFRVENPVKTKTTAASLNSMTLDPENCILTSKGKINMSLNSGPLQIGTFGNLNHYVIPDSTNMEIAMLLDFAFSEDAIEKFRSQMGSINLGAVSLLKSPYYNAMEQLLTKKDIEKLDNEMSLTGKFRKFPDELIRTIFIADVHLRWDTASNSWISYGPIGIGSIGKNVVARYVKGIIEIAKKRNGDDFTFYFQLTDNDWYFFNYRNRLLQAISSSLEFNDQLLNAVKSKSEAKKMENWGKGYHYSISTDRKKRDFLRKFQPEE